MFCFRLLSLVGIPLAAGVAVANVRMPTEPRERLVEWTIESEKDYADPFNDVDVDVVFSKSGQSWRVPTFWRGGSHWTVRFAPPEPGQYAYRLESTDQANPDLNGHDGHVTITAYSGNNPLLKHGMLRVSRNRRYFEQADGTPFYWLGDTSWTGLSDRLPWDGFQTLVADRQAKGFTVMQICGGLIPDDEPEVTDPGFANEGGAVWDPEFKRINPLYFDYADRRIQRLVDAGIAPAIVGGWWEALKQMGSAKLEKHWRYLIARYGAYPVFWILGGEIVDPPQTVADRLSPPFFRHIIAPGWTEIARYVRATDPYHHPLTAHEFPPPFDIPLQDPLLTDFDLIQPGHWGWPSIGSEVVQVNRRYARTDVIKPVVVGEIGYEMIGGTNLEDFQRVSFWLAMLNGAAGHTYGAAPTYEINNPEKPMQPVPYTFLTWEEGMHLPGSYQTGLASKLLRQYPWWQFAPHPEWVTPGGTTLLEPNIGPRVFNAKDFDWEAVAVTNAEFAPTDDYMRQPETVAPGGEWKARQGTFRRAYAAGIAGKVRFVYMPYLGLLMPPPPTLLALEKGVRYHAYYWDPMLGIHFDLGTVEVPAPGPIEFKGDFSGVDSSLWSEQGATKARQNAGKFFASGDTLSVVQRMHMRDGVLAVDARSDSSAGLLLRYQDPDNYVAVIYSPRDKVLYLLTRARGVESKRLGAVPVVALGTDVHLTGEARENWGAASLTDGKTTYSTPIVDIASGESGKSSDPLGAVGLLHQEDGKAQSFTNFEVRRSPTIKPDGYLERKLYDARGRYRGDLSGPAWDKFGRNKTILLDAYRPERFPSAQDWVLVLEAPH